MLALVLGLSSCGSPEASPDVRPNPGNGSSESGGTSAGGSPSASSSPSDEGTTVARSNLEDRPPVKAMRAWASAVRTEVNNRSSSHAPTRALSTKRGARTIPDAYAQDYGLRYRGPLPFTPLAVEVSGGTAKVPACVQSSGWAVNGSGLSPQDNALSAVTFVLKRTGGRWKMDRLTGRQQSCADVDVKGYAS